MNFNQANPPAAPAQSRNRRGCFGCFGRMFMVSVVILAFVIFSGVTIAGTVIYSSLSREIEEGIVKLDAARDRETFETTQVLDRNGELLWEIFGEGKRTEVSLNQIPADLINATISVEDDTFYENIGLDAPSLIAALIANVRNPDGRPVGGSTITQQLVRHLAFDYEERTAVSYNRKAKEIALAWMMNRQFSKDEVLEMYLNEIYYGNLAYGIEAASQTYFEKSATELTLAEASLLAALPQSPVELDPLVNFEGAKARQWTVLNLMVSEGHLTQEQTHEIFQQPLNFAAQEVSLVAPHFAVYVRQQLEDEFGAEVVANGGLRVTTSLDLSYQRLAEQLAQQHVDGVAPEHNLTNASLVAMNPKSGEILAMVGSVDYKDETIDGHVNVALSPQQPGSSIKPLTYAAAISPQEEAPPAWTVADILWDVSVDYPDSNGSTYTPVNYDSRFHGPVRLRTALANSYNIPAVLLLQDIGVPAFISFAEKMGIDSFSENPERYGLSLTLGGGELTPLELTTAYAIFANEGQKVDPVSILKVEKPSSNETLFTYEPAVAETVIDPRVAYLISDILDDDEARVPAMGRNNPLVLPFAAAAKTGTTNDFRDNWTMGFTPNLAVGVWTGNTDNSEMINISGLTGAAPLWSEFMLAVYNDYGLLATLGVVDAPATEFTPPDGLEKRPLCSLASVTLDATECAPAGSEWFLTGVLGIEETAVSPDAVAWEQLEPAVWRVPSVQLPPIPIEIVDAAAEEAALGAEDDEDALPPQLYCHFDKGFALAEMPPDTLPRIFLSAPRNKESLKGAHEWAQANGLAVMPAMACNEELLTLARDPNTPAIWRITDPKDGDVVNGVIPIVGTADFDPEEVQFYKFELGIPQENGDVQWLTLGNTSNVPVVNGTLEMLHADALPPGSYFLRLIVIKDSNYVGEPHTITFITE